MWGYVRPLTAQKNAICPAAVSAPGGLRTTGHTVGILERSPQPPPLPCHVIISRVARVRYFIAPERRVFAEPRPTLAPRPPRHRSAAGVPGRTNVPSGGAVDGGEFLTGNQSASAAALFLTCRQVFPTGYPRRACPRRACSSRAADGCTAARGGDDTFLSSSRSRRISHRRRCSRFAERVGCMYRVNHGRTQPVV